MTADPFEKTLSPDEMDVVDWEKLKFVEEYLAPMVEEATGGMVYSCEYMKSSVAPVECVAMKIRVNDSVPLQFRADVTADSLWAIAKDVMRAVTKQYE